jgi:hypothetical protein
MALGVSRTGFRGPEGPMVLETREETIMPTNGPDSPYRPPSNSIEVKASFRGQASSNPLYSCGFGRGGGDRTRTPFEFAIIYAGPAAICIWTPCCMQQTSRNRNPIAAVCRLDNSARTFPTTKCVLRDVGYKPTSPGISMT